MALKKRYTRFCGIDIAKQKHVARIIDSEGQCVARSQSFNNDATGYQSILARLKDAGGPRKVQVAMEATGHYWYSLHDFLVDHRYEVGQLVALAGLDLTVFQTGQYKAPRRRISKRGSPVLRHTLWQMAHRACYREGDLRDYWLRRQGPGLSQRSAVTATALKLCHLVWRILTDRRDYLPQRPNTKHSGIFTCQSAKKRNSSTSTLTAYSWSFRYVIDHHNTNAA